jgi:hypothetical protein
MWPPLAPNAAISGRCVLTTADGDLSPPARIPLRHAVGRAITLSNGGRSLDRRGVGPRDASQDLGPARSDGSGRGSPRGLPFCIRGPTTRLVGKGGGAIQQGPSAERRQAAIGGRCRLRLPTAPPSETASDAPGPLSGRSSGPPLRCVQPPGRVGADQVRRACNCAWFRHRGVRAHEHCSPMTLYPTPDSAGATVWPRPRSA